MKATTIKIEGDLLREIESAKPPSQSVSAFVRSVLRKELDRRQLRNAAAEYQAFVSENPEERQWLDAWERSDLVSPPDTGRAGR